MKTIKRILFITPIVLVLQVFILSSISAFAAADEDYSEFFHEYSDLEDKGFHYDLDELNEHIITYDDRYVELVDLSTYYFTHIYFSSAGHEAFTSGNSCSLFVRNYGFDSSESVFEDDEYIAYKLIYVSEDTYTYSSGSFTYTSTHGYRGSDYDRYNGYTYFVYHKASGRCAPSNTTSFPYATTNYLHHIYLQDSNIPDFPFADGVNHNTGGLNVSVDIDPDLVGKVNSTLSWNGQQLDNPFIRFNFANNGKKTVHYSFFITDSGYDVLSNLKNFSLLSSSRLPDSIKYVFINETWREVEYIGDSYTVAKGQHYWHVQAAGTNHSNFICWSQMQLIKNHNYDVVVLAYESDYLYIPSANNSSSFDTFDKVFEVYRSTFSLTKDTEFNPNDDSFGNTAYIPGQEIDYDNFSQYVDGDGITQSGKFTRDDIRVGLTSSDHIYDSSSGGRFGGDFNSLSYSISGFFSFFNQVFSLFPSNFISIISLAITSIIVISIFKGVFR